MMVRNDDVDDADDDEDDDADYDDDDDGVQLMTTMVWYIGIHRTGSMTMMQQGR